MGSGGRERAAGGSAPGGYAGPLRAIGLGALLMLAAAPASATVVVRLDLPELVAAADEIVLGEVSGIAGSNRDGRIVTTVSLRITQQIKGVSRPTVSVMVMGGLHDGLAQHIAGAPRFAPGERVIVFLRAREGGANEVVGWGQGKFRVVPGLDGGHFVRDLNGMSLVDRAEDGTLAPAASQDGEVVPLADFIQRVAAALGAESVEGAEEEGTGVAPAAPGTAPADREGASGGGPADPPGPLGGAPR